MKILICDDDEISLDRLANDLAGLDYKVLTALRAEKALTLFKSDPEIRIVICDYKMPDKDGLWLLAQIRTEPARLYTYCIINTALGPEMYPDAVDADDFWLKETDLKKIEARLAGATTYLRLRGAIESDAAKKQEAFRAGHPTVKGRYYKETAHRLQCIAQSKGAVMITGETGVGKEVIARQLHELGPRRAKPFIPVNCAAFTDTLSASELFGHEKGAFTGADRQKIGRFEAAHGGTLFLDEVGDLPMPTQIRLLRVLQDQRFERVGGTRSIQVDVRIVCATNRDITSLIEKGEFRLDLMHRLNVFRIHIPPLRQRADEIEALFTYFLRRFCGEDQTPPSVEPAAIDYLSKRNWAGNIRELENLAQRALAFLNGDTISVAQIEEDARLSEEPPRDLSFTEEVKRFETKLISEALRETKGNVSKAAKNLKLAPATLSDHIRVLSIDPHLWKADRH